MNKKSSKTFLKHVLKVPQNKITFQVLKALESGTLNTKVISLILK